MLCALLTCAQALHLHLGRASQHCWSHQCIRHGREARQAKWLCLNHTAHNQPHLA